MSDAVSVQSAVEVRDTEENLSRDSHRFELEATDADFPERMLESGYCPDYLFGIGNESSLGRGIGVVGARNATPYGIRAAQLVAGWASDLGLVVYSGCARGCDQAAHRGALDAGGKTVAVMGCGPDVVYPTRAKKLLEEIAIDGAIISEYEWGTPPMKHRFIERNRLIAALSILVVVTEARLPSGTLSTVHHALDLGVAVGAIPGSILCLESAAPNRLISEGAFPICGRDDLALACGLTAERVEISTLFDSSNSDAALIDTKATPTSISVYQAAAAMPMTIDEMASELALPLPEVAEIVGRLEVSGRLIQRPDGRYMAGEGF